MVAPSSSPTFRFSLLRFLARIRMIHFVVLHLGVEPRLRSTADVNIPVLLKLMHEIRSAARRTRGVERIEFVYSEHPGVRLNV